MRRFLLVLLTTLIVVGFASAQNEVDAESLGRDTAQQALQQVSVSRFEDPGFWNVYIPSDQGVITHIRLEGAPRGKEPIPAEEEAGITPQDRYVLGVKTEFFPPRSDTSLFVQARRPLAVPGIAKTISVWVVGRNFNHRLYVVLRDQFGGQQQLYMGRLNFSGWKQLTVAVPPNINQRDTHYLHRTGIQIVGFLIEPDLLETYGQYYVYFDDLRVLSDLFSEQSRDVDDMVDSW
jgi:hypothetical protein